MQYKVLKIEEDMDFGCEERQPGEALMSVVLMEDENGREILLPWTGSISCGNCKTERDVHHWILS